MNEQRGSDGWVSPGGTPVAPEPLTGSDPAPAAEAPANNHGPGAVAAPAAGSPERRGLSTGATAAIWVGSITLGLLIIGGIAAGLIAVVTTVTNSLTELESEYTTTVPLLRGEPGEPRAAAPLSCTDRCITGLKLPAVVLTEDERQALDLSETFGAFGDYPETTPGAEHSASVRVWRGEKAEPDECFVTSPAAPIAFGVDERPRYDGSTVHFVSSFGDADYWQSATQYARVFSDSATAVEHMEMVDALLAGCDQYTMGSGLSAWSPLVTPAPALDLPDEVAAVGWREDEAGSRYYAYDLQLGNIVVRVTMSAWQSSELEFREVVQAVAERLAAIEVAD